VNSPAGETVQPSPDAASTAGGRRKVRRIVAVAPAYDLVASAPGDVLADERAWKEFSANELAWQEFTREQIKKVLNTFLLMNGAVLAFVAVMWLGEFIGRIVAPAAVPSQTITGATIVTLIQATAVQLGALALGMGIALVRVGRIGKPNAASSK